MGVDLKQGSAKQLAKHLAALRSCRLCPQMQAPVVFGEPVRSRILLVGQAPGDKEPRLGRPFAWTAGKTLFSWFRQSCGLSEAEVRASVYFAAVCRCFPGKKETGGDRVPSPEEIGRCSRWLEREFELLRPALVLPVGKLALSRFLAVDRLDAAVGRVFRMRYHGHWTDVIPLPHPSGASPWHRVGEGRRLLGLALQAVRRHPAMVSVCREIGDRPEKGLGRSGVVVGAGFEPAKA